MDTVSKLKAIWAELFAKDDISNDDDFFQLGGDSYLVMTMMVSIEEKFGIFIDSGLVFETPVLSALAARIDQAQELSAA